MPRAPNRPPRSQMLQQLFSQDAARLDVEAAIDGLVRHVQGLRPRKRPLEPAGDLLWRPAQLQFLRTSLPQPSMDRQLARLWPERMLPGLAVSGGRPILCGAAIAAAAIHLLPEGPEGEGKKKLLSLASGLGDEGGVEGEEGEGETRRQLAHYTCARCNHGSLARKSTLLLPTTAKKRVASRNT
jgi:hypothetical protein